MTNSVHAAESLDPYAALEGILDVIGRSWLSEEWRLEDIRVLALTAVAERKNREATTLRHDLPGTYTVTVEGGAKALRKIRPSCPEGL